MLYCLCYTKKIGDDTMKQFCCDALTVKISDTAAELGDTAGKDIIQAIQKELRKKEEINIIFAAAPSQNETLRALLAEKNVPWEKINAFHMDEYIGLPKGSPASFGYYLAQHIFKKAPFRAIHYINASATDLSAEAQRYSALLTAYPADIICLGIGENGHLAFNDPPVADFNDPLLVKKVALDQTCRMQQVHDGCFASLDEVPRYALTLTIPALFNAKHLFCSVPYAAKAAAIKEMLTTNKIDEHCPASILRRHPHAVLYCDKESAAKINATI